MKYIFSAFVLLFVNSAMACPDISGVFDCQEKGKLKINMREDGYEFIENDQIKFVPADNKSYELDETSNYMAFCKEKTFHIRINIVNEEVGPITMETAYFIHTNNDLGIITGLKYKVDGQEKVFPYGAVCTRIE